MYDVLGWGGYYFIAHTGAKNTLEFTIAVDFSNGARRSPPALHSVISFSACPISYATEGDITKKS